MSLLWAVEQMDTTHSPYASAQRLLEILGDVPDLWAPGGGQQVRTLLAQWNEQPDHREELTEQISTHLRSLHDSDVPPLI